MKVFRMTKQIIAVGGGKGGVGKSIIAANLAIALAQTGARTILVDADLGGANLHTLFGIDRPAVLLEHFISGKIETLNNVTVQTSVQNLRLVCGGMPVLGTANPLFSQKAKLIRHIRALDADQIVLDIGAGIGFNALDLFNAANCKIVAFVPQLTSLHNGYGFLKAAVHRQLERLISDKANECLQSSNPEAGQESLRHVIARIAAEDKNEADKARMIINDQRVFLVGNMVRSDRDRHVVAALQQMIHDHLIIDATILGIIKFGDKIERSVNERRPFMISAGIESNAEVFREMAQTLRNTQVSTGKRNSLPVIVAEDHSERPPRPSQYDRKEPRYPTSRMRVVLTDGTGATHVGHLLNIAHGGALTAFESKMPMPVKGILVIGPSRSGILVEVPVEERHRNRKDQRIGFTFLTLDRAMKTGVADLVAEAAAETAVHRISEVE